MKQCPKCNNICQDFDNVCNNCGTSLNPANNFNNQNVESNPNQGNFSNPNPGNFNNPNPGNFNNPNPGNFNNPNPNNFNNSNNMNNPGGFNNYSMNPPPINLPPQGKTNGMAIASLILGIVGLVTVCCCGLGILPGAAAVILGFIAKGKIRDSYGAQKGSGLALTGLILGFVAVGLGLVYIIWIFASGAFSSGNGSFWENFTREFERSYNNSRY